MKNLINKIKNIIFYKIESILTKSVISQTMTLTVVALIIILLSTIILINTNLLPIQMQNVKFLELIWFNMMHIIDQGSILEDTGSWSFLFFIFLITISGLVIFSTFISIIVENFSGKIKELQKGRSPVIEKNHIIILGWSSKIYNIIFDMINGYDLVQSKHKKLCITILADKNKTEMEDFIEDQCTNSNKARIICRTGNPIILEKLKKLSMSKSRTILVLQPNRKNAEMYVLKTLLAIIQILKNDLPYNLSVHIIAEMENVDNIELMKKQFNKIFNKSDKIELVPVNTKKIASQIIAQTSLQPGLSHIYEELLKFSKTDNEIYFKKFKHGFFKGKQERFINLINEFEDSSLIGYIKANSSKPVINPLVNSKDAEMYINQDDELIFIAESKKKIEYNYNKDKSNRKFNIKKRKLELPEMRTVIFGWNDKIFRIIEEIDKYVIAGSKIIIISKKEDGAEEITNKYPHEKTHSGKQDIIVKCVKTNIVDEEILDNIEIDKYNNIVILNYFQHNLSNMSDIAEMEANDTITMKSLLNIREYFEKNPSRKGENFSIVAELEFAHNKELVPVTNENEFIVSDAIISCLFAQITYRKEVGIVYLDTLFSDEGSEIYLKKSKYYVPYNKEIRFSEVVEAAKEYKEIAIGYMKNDEIYLNPPKDKEIVLNENDKIITLSEEFIFLK